MPVMMRTVLTCSQATLHKRKYSLTNKYFINVLPACLSACLFVCLSVCFLSVCLLYFLLSFFCLSVSLLVWLFISKSVCHSVYMSVRMYLSIYCFYFINRNKRLQQKMALHGSFILILWWFTSIFQGSIRRIVTKN